MPATKTVFQFRIDLLGVASPIWRRILVPKEYSFWDLHVAIQDAMGWFDCHLHAFRFKPRRKRKEIEIGIPDGWGELDIQPGWELLLDDYLSIGDAIEYLYDFGDDWQHTVLLEGELIREKGKRYPLCTAGERACPPEDCGGTYGYEDLLEVLADPKHEEHDSMKEWLGGWYPDYDPNVFDPAKVDFRRPGERLKNVLRSRL